MREESRADVKVERQPEGAAAAAAAERQVTCSSLEVPESEYCGAAEALMMCASRVVSERGAANERGEVLLRLLAPGNQMGALIGPKGSTIRWGEWWPWPGGDPAREGEGGEGTAVINSGRA